MSELTKKQLKKGNADFLLKNKNRKIETIKIKGEDGKIVTYSPEFLRDALKWIEREENELRIKKEIYFEHLLVKEEKLRKKAELEWCYILNKYKQKDKLLPEVPPCFGFIHSIAIVKPGGENVIKVYDTEGEYLYTICLEKEIIIHYWSLNRITDPKMIFWLEGFDCNWKETYKKRRQEKQEKRIRDETILPEPYR